MKITFPRNVRMAGIRHRHYCRGRRASCSEYAMRPEGLTLVETKLGSCTFAERLTKLYVLRRIPLSTPAERLELTR